MLLLTLLPLLLCNFVAAADVQQCLKTHVVINRSNLTNPYIPIERFNGLEYAYIATQTDVAPCEKLHYSWTLNPGNVQCSSGINPTLEEVEYAQRSFYDISCGAPSAFWKGTTAHSVSVTLKNPTNPAQMLTKVLATNVYVKSEIPTLNACVASLAVPTVNQTFSVGSTAAYVVKLSYDSKACSGLIFRAQLMTPKFPPLCDSVTLSNKLSSITTTCPKAIVGSLKSGQYTINLKVESPVAHNTREKMSAPFYIQVS